MCMDYNFNDCIVQGLVFRKFPNFKKLYIVCPEQKNSYNFQEILTIVDVISFVKKLKLISILMFPSVDYLMLEKKILLSKGDAYVERFTTKYVMRKNMWCIFYFNKCKLS